jgi:hypothetical protein
MAREILNGDVLRVTRPEKDASPTRPSVLTKIECDCPELYGGKCCYPNCSEADAEVVKKDPPTQWHECADCEGLGYGGCNDADGYCYTCEAAGGWEEAVPQKGTSDSGEVK